jgi:hypothetical protein
MTSYPLTHPEVVALARLLLAARQSRGVTINDWDATTDANRRMLLEDARFVLRNLADTNQQIPAKPTPQPAPPPTPAKATQLLAIARIAQDRALTMDWVGVEARRLYGKAVNDLSELDAANFIERLTAHRSSAPKPQSRTEQPIKVMSLRDRIKERRTAEQSA